MVSFPMKVSFVWPFPRSSKVATSCAPSMASCSIPYCAGSTLFPCESEKYMEETIFSCRTISWYSPAFQNSWPSGALMQQRNFRVGGKFLCCMRAPDGQEFWNAGEYHEIVLHEKIVSSMYFSDSQGNKVEPAQYGIEHEAIDGAHDVVTFEDLGNGQTKLTFIGNETMESAKTSGQVEGWNQILDKVAAVVAGLAQAK